MLLKNKTAVIYGAAGAIGGAVARAFAREGASVFLTGRQLAPVEALAREINLAGGTAAAAEVDALDESAVDRHLQAVITQAGRVDVSFNAVGFPTTEIVGVPLLDLDLAQFSRPIADYTRSYFLTARLAARQMVPHKSGVIMTITSIPAREGTTLNGGYGPAHAAKDALTRDLSAELAPHGLRVVNLRPHGLVETTTMQKLYDTKVAKSGMTFDQFQNHLANWSHPKRLQRLTEVANTAVFLASDRASAITGTTVNLTMGAVSD